MKEVTSFRTRNLFNRHVLLSNYGAKLLSSGNEKTMEQNDRKRDHKECYNKKFCYISKHEIVFLLFLLIFIYSIHLGFQNQSLLSDFKTMVEKDEFLLQQVMGIFSL